MLKRTSTEETRRKNKVITKKSIKKTRRKNIKVIKKSSKETKRMICFVVFYLSFMFFYF